MRRLSQVGFKRDFVRTAILPDWWADACADDPSILPDIEIRVARFLDVPLSTVRSAGDALRPPSYAGAQLRRVRDVDRDRLAPAIHSAIQIAGAVVRNLRATVRESRTGVLPSEGLAWRAQMSRTHLTRSNCAVSLENILADLWERGIPTIPLDVLPAPSFQGAACIVEDRPVILLGHRNDEPGRIAFWAAHEAGHIAAGDCSPEEPVVDEDDEVLDDADIEQRADQYAIHLLMGDNPAPPVDGTSFKQLAREAAEIERETGADASTVIFSWAARTGDYGKAAMAVKALYRATGGRRLVREHFERHVDLEDASESDRALLRCVYSEPKPIAAAG